jgi:thiamine-monophosphate kinase
VVRVPYSGAAQAVIARDAGMRETALTGGDDYEILCTVPPDKAESFRAAAYAAKVPVTEIGEIAAGEGARFRDVEGHALTFKRTSFSHF